MNDSKSGFVYLWHDMKRNMFYVGCHWGKDNDGYICSSQHMRKTYKRRPETFRRRIIQRITTSRSDLIDAEYKWLQLINEDELYVKYYNHTVHKFNHWNADNEYNRAKIGKRISIALHKPEVQAKIRKPKSPEARAHMSVAQTGKVMSPECRVKLSVANTGERNPNY